VRVRPVSIAPTGPVNTDYVSDAPQHAEVLILHADDFARIGTKDPTSAAGDVRFVWRGRHVSPCVSTLVRRAEGTMFDRVCVVVWLCGCVVVWLCVNRLPSHHFAAWTRWWAKSRDAIPMPKSAL
jgi:hypothetical protein